MDKKKTNQVKQEDSGKKPDDPPMDEEIRVIKTYIKRAVIMREHDNSSATPEN